MQTTESAVVASKTEPATAWGLDPLEKCRITVRRFMQIYKEFHYSESVEDALLALGQSSNATKLVAGGTDLLLDIQQGRHDPVEKLVDITNIPELKVLEEREDRIFIGAAVPHRRITNSPLINQQVQALAEACGLIGGPQVRNVATLGGNVAHALPAADGTIALMALEARAEIASLNERRLIPLADLFKGPGQSTLDPKGELLAGFYLPSRQGNQASAFKRVMRPQGVAIAILNCAVWLQREGEQIKDIRISIGPSGPVPRRLFAVEDTLRGNAPNEAAIGEAHRTVLEESNFRTSRHRATLEYREEMAGVLLRDTVQLAWERAAL